MVHLERPLPGVAVLRLDNPPVNTLSRPVRAALAGALAGLAAEESLRCLVLTGTGEKAFCAGADLGEEHHMDPAAVPTFAAEMEGLFQQVYEFPCPVMGALNGHALGAGFELALACDLRVARAGARLGTPAASIGLIAGTTRLVRLLGESRARELCLTGRQVPAEEAAGWGLVHRVAGPAAFRDTVMALAGELVDQAPLSMRRIKAALNRTLDLTMAQALAGQQADLVWLLGTADHREAVAAFLAKRKPEFKGS